VRLFDRLDAVRYQWDVLRHPFYKSWSSGELSREEIAFYAGEYRHAVVALADAAEATADACDASLRAELAGHAAEERAHVALWDRFADVLEADLQREPLEETAACARAWRSASDELEGLVVLYAVEAGQPAISRTKLEGLVAHYGIAEDSAATGYFTLHAELDHEHARSSRAVLEERAGEADEDRLVAAAARALEGNWTLLDGVERSSTRG
jgi:pyrroloquinoline-quinone synthase